MKFLFLISLLFITIVSTISVAFAGLYDNCVPTGVDAAQFLKDCAQQTSGVNPNTPSDKEGIRERVASIAEKAIGLGALFAIGFIVYAGIQYTTAYGDDEKLKHAKSTGIYAGVGLLFLMLAFGLVDILIRFIYTFGG